MNLHYTQHMETETPEWRSVVGFERFYAVSSDGRVRNASGRELKLSLNKNGYPQLSLTVAGKSYCRRVHCLMLEAFVGPRPPGMLGCHNDDVPRHNVLSNLRWDTHAGNMADRDRHGTTAVGERAGGHKLTAEQVLAIRNAPRGKGAAVGRSFGVGDAATSAIQRGKTWACVGGKTRPSITARGVDHPAARITPEDVRAIRSDERPQCEIARHYGIGQPHVSSIKLRKLWRDVA